MMSKQIDHAPLVDWKILDEAINSTLGTSVQWVNRLDVREVDEEIWLGPSAKTPETSGYSAEE